MSSTVHPITPFEVTLSCMSTSTMVYVLASTKHYGILVPLDALPELAIQAVGSNPVDIFFDELTEYFGILAEKYVKSIADSFSDVHIPSIPQTARLHGKIYSLDVSLFDLNPKEAMPGSFDTMGDHLFITEAGIDIDEFITGDNRSSPTLH